MYALVCIDWSIKPRSHLAEYIPILYDRYNFSNCKQSEINRNDENQGEIVYSNFSHIRSLGATGAVSGRHMCMFSTHQKLDLIILQNYFLH